MLILGGVMKHSKELILECKKILLETKADLLNRVKSTKGNLSEFAEDKGGDEGDQTVRLLAESDAVANQERIRYMLVEIENALMRIENGKFGVCEETEELIEAERLLAIPWTRLSIEGAEIRESMQKRYVQK
jgi:DnaK suppressor protein